MAIAWPASVKPRSVMFHPQSASRSGGQSTSGGEQIVESAAGRWRASVHADIRNDVQIRAWRAFLAQTRGRANTIDVPFFDARRQSWPVDAYGRTLHPGFTRDKTLDGTAYEFPTIPSNSEIIATVYANADLRAISISIAITQGQPLIAGQYFGISSRLYLISSVASTIVVGSGYRQAVAFWPELRAAAVAGTPVLITRPVCEMRFASDDSGELMLERLRYGSLNADFVEAF